uniref:Uncharacterized protein n=1 Tax=Brassica campestris TaxID=3711 RepID=M4DS67_BRACM
MHSPTFPFSPCSSCVHTIAGEQAISIDVPCFQFTSDPFHGEREQKEKVRRECCVSEPSITDLHRHEPLVTGELHHVTGDQDASIVAMFEKSLFSFTNLVRLNLAENSFTGGTDSPVDLTES